jgi:hypothetical protein
VIRVELNEANNENILRSMTLIIKVRGESLLFPLTPKVRKNDQFHWYVGLHPMRPSMVEASNISFPTTRHAGGDQGTSAIAFFSCVSLPKQSQH